MPSISSAFPNGLLLALYNRLQSTDPRALLDSSSDETDSLGNGNDRSWYRRQQPQHTSGRGYTPNTMPFPATSPASPNCLTKRQHGQYPASTSSKGTAEMERKKTRRRKQRQPFPLLSLPLDLLHHLVIFLPASSKVALSLTCRDLFMSLPHVSRAMGKVGANDECARRGVRFAFEEAIAAADGRQKMRAEKGKEVDAVERLCGSGDSGCSGDTIVASSKGTVGGRMRCALCKALYPVSLFDRAGFVSLDVESDDDGEVTDDGTVRVEEAVGRTSTSRRNTITRPPSSSLNIRNRVCKWHDGRFQRTLKRHCIRANERVHEGWKLEEACMHCGSVLAWERDGQGEGKCDCEKACETCWRRKVWCFTRVLEEEEDRIKEDVVLRWIF